MQKAVVSASGNWCKQCGRDCRDRWEGEDGWSGAGCLEMVPQGTAKFCHRRYAANWFLSSLLLWHAPLRVRSAKRRQCQTSLSRVDDPEPCQALHLGSGYRISGPAEYSSATLCENIPMVSSSFLEGEVVWKIFLAFVSSGIRAVCPNRERHRDWTMAERWGCLVVRLAPCVS